MTDEQKAIHLPAQLYDRIQKRVNASEFGSVDEYVTFIIEEVIKEEGADSTLNQDEEEELKKRLRNLGYLD